MQASLCMTPCKRSAVRGTQPACSQGREGRLALWPLSEDGRPGRYKPGADLSTATRTPHMMQDPRAGVGCRQPLAAIVTLQYTFCRAALAGQRCRPTADSSVAHECRQASLPLTIAAVGQDAAAISLHRLQPHSDAASHEVSWCSVVVCSCANCTD